MKSDHATTVSVILVNYRGAEDTLVAIRNLLDLDLDLPQGSLEIIVVDNNSQDGSLALFRESTLTFRVVESPENLGFAGGCNLGVRSSSGEFVAFLNNDARPEKGWISAALKEFQRDHRVGAVASRVLDWEGKKVDFVDSALAWYGMGYKPFVGEPSDRLGHDRKPVLFGTGAAMFVRRHVFDALGGFDESYFMFFEDVDFGWRLNLSGWKFMYVPESVARHKHHASMDKLGQFKETYLLERNALFTLYKNLSQERLDSALPAALALAVRRSVSKGGLDSAEFEITRSQGDGRFVEANLDKEVLAGVYAIDQFTQALPRLMHERQRIQASRVVAEAVMWPLFGDVDAPVLPEAGYREGYENIVTAFPVLSPPSATRILIVTGDPIGAKVAGPAIRAWNMAEQLSLRHQVTLLSLSSAERTSDGFSVVHVPPGADRKFSQFERWADVILFQGEAMRFFPSLRNSQKILIADLYDPMHLEQLEQGRHLHDPSWGTRVDDATFTLNEQISRADFFLAASDKQRSFWLGHLASLGRINPKTYEGDPDLEGLISVVPFGLPAQPPVASRPAIRGVHPAVGPESKILIWSGGIYNWFDPLTLIRAVALLLPHHPELRLFFLGTKHPHPGVPEMEVLGQARALAQDLGVLDTAVIFNDEWVKYDERANYLLDADIGVSTHYSHIETSFSFRTRILDYLWAGLPMVVTKGDHFADLIEEKGLGLTVDAENVEQLSEALEQALFDEAFIAECRERVLAARRDYEWPRVLAPLTSFLESPSLAGDRPAASQGRVERSTVRRSKPYGFAHNVRRSLAYLRAHGIVALAKKVRGRI